VAPGQMDRTPLPGTARPSQGPTQGSTP